MKLYRKFFWKIYKLQQKNIVKVEWEYKDHKNEKKIQIISLALDKDIIDEYIINNKIRLGNKQKETIDFLKKFESIDRYNLQEVLKTSKATIDSLLEKQLINIEEIQYYRKPNEIYKVEDKNIDLNEEQAFVTSTIKNNMFDEDKNPYMIHGVTGSGKTEVFSGNIWCQSDYDQNDRQWFVWWKCRQAKKRIK